MNKYIRLMMVGAMSPSLQLIGQESVEGSGDPVFELEAYEVTGLDTIAVRAIPGLTPVAFSTIDKEDLSARLASQDLPLALNTSPSVYATTAGGGAGDARVNVRGFDQRNVAVMINGVPVNDMENGWVYWSNWDGVGDVASSIQLQRGMSNLNLAVPSIGGTLNILTDPAAKEAGGLVKVELGSDNFLKMTAVVHTGVVNEKFAFSGAIVRKTGDGYVDGVWTDAWAYFLGASYQVNAQNKLELYALGAPQLHGQNLYQRNIGTYSAEFARGLPDYDEAALERYYERGFGYNEAWNFVDPSYDANQYDHTGTTDRKFKNIINERENFYHKPQVNLNWYLDPEADWKLDTVFYYSGGEGGGTGTYGSVARVNDPGGYFHRNRDWNAEIAENAANLDENGEARSTGILRNSRNNQWTIGAVSRATVDLTDRIELSAGVDWRTAEIEHYREVRDLLGGDYYLESSSDFWTEAEQKRRLGDKINYDFTNQVDWLGTYLQGAYNDERISAFAMTGYSQIQYHYENFFAEDPSRPGSTLKAKTDWIDGIQVKGGLLYRLNPNLNVYGNAGYVEKVPIFDAVIDDSAGQKYENPKNEKFESFELGVNLLNDKGTLSIGANIYQTNWTDRTFTEGYTNPTTGEETLISLGGVDQLHRGFEVEMFYIVNKFLRFDASLSINSWEYEGDVRARYRPEDQSSDPVDYNLYIDGLKVGDAPQTQFAFITTFTPNTSFRMQFVGRYYADHFANFDPLGRTDPTDRTQSWEVPEEWVWDLHFSYVLASKSAYDLSVFLHVLNLTDKVYIQDATDNDAFNSFDGDHDADDAAVFFAPPRRFNLGASLRF
jgi:iron complex outermembrane receptor protein